MSLDTIREIIQKSNYLVCLMGRGVSSISGANFYRDDFEYEVEEKYGASIEEMFTTAFYNNRPRKFFEFYREEILKKRGEPNECHRTLARMEADGKLKAIVTRGILGLSRRGGCNNVLAAHGTIYDNICPRCGRKYEMEFIRDTKPLPICESCGAIVRPQIALMGDMLDNKIITRAADEIEKADVLLILGANLNSRLCENCVKYYTGNKLIVMKEQPHYSDVKADYVWNGNLMDAIPQLYP